MFAPRGVAVVGASVDPQKPGGQVLKALTLNGFAGGVYPVNPGHAELRGLACYESIAQVPDPVDLAVIALPAHLAHEALEQCAARSIKAVVVLSSGFAEAGGSGGALQDELADTARQHGLALCGPNCLGVISAPERLTANFLLQRLPSGLALPDRVSLISQSGSLAAQMVLLLAERGVGACRVVSSGNEAALDFADYLAWMADDPATRIIAGYLEGVRDIDRLGEALALAGSAGKPVLILPAGRTPQAAAAAARHTGNAYGSLAACQALFDRHRVRTFTSLDQMCGAAAILAASPSPAAGGVAVLSPFGGAGVLLCDLLRECGAPLATLSAETSAGMAGLLPEFASSLNPVDLTPQVMARWDLTMQCATAVLNDPGTAALIICSWIWPEHGELQAGLLTQITRSTTKPVLHLVWGPQPGAPEAMRMLRESAIPAESDMAILARGVKELFG